MTIIGGIRTQNLEKSLNSCLLYCNDRLIPCNRDSEIASYHRSKYLQEEAQIVFPESCHTIANIEFKQRYQRFNDARSMRIRNLVLPDNLLHGELYRPKSLLVTDFSISLFDGALIPETFGFIDEDYMPPWDCWLDIVKVETSFGAFCLVSWVPEWISDKVDYSIPIDPSGCMSWLVVSSKNTLELHGWGKEW